MPNDLLDQIKKEKEKRGGSFQGDGLLNDIALERQRRKKVNEEKGFLDSAGEVVSAIGNAWDSVTNAPLRKAADTYAETGDLGESIMAGVGQIGEDPNMVPSGKEVMTKFGFSPEDSLSDVMPEIKTPGLTNAKLEAQGFKIQEKPQKLIEKGDPLDISEAGLAGFGFELLDPLALVPIAKGAQITAKGAKKGIKAFKDARKARRAARVALEGSEAVERAKDTQNVIKESLSSMKKSMETIFNPKQAKDYGHFKSIAERNGIDPNILPESVEFGKDSFLSRRARNIAEGPTGQLRLEKHNKAVDEISGALFKKINRLSGGGASDFATAGNDLRNSYTKGVKRFFDQQDVTYSSVQKMKPGMKFSEENMKALSRKLNGIEKFAKGRVKRGVTSIQQGQAKELLNAIERLKNNNGSLKQIREAMRDIGEVAYPSNGFAPGTMPSDVEKLREIYKVANQEVIKTVRRELGDKVADNLLQNNRAMSKFFKQQEKVEKIMRTVDADEMVFKKAISGADTETIKAIKSVVSPEDFKRIKGAYLDSLIKRNQDGDVLFRSTFNNMMNKNNLPRLKEIFTPAEIREVVEVLKLGDRVGPKFLSSSGTGASNAFGDIKNTLRSVLENEALLEAGKKKARMPKAPTGGKKVREVINEAADEMPVYPVNEVRAKSALIGGRLLSEGPEGSRVINSTPPETTEKKWIKEGVIKAYPALVRSGLDTQENQRKLLETAQGRRFLARASALNPESKSFKELEKKIIEFLSEGK